MTTITWASRLALAGASNAEIASIDAAFVASSPGNRHALDELIRSMDNTAVATMLTNWRGGDGPFGSGFPFGGLPFGTHAPVLSGNPADDAYFIGAGTGAPGTPGSGGSGVSQIVAGTNVTVSPSGGTGAVTVNATGGSGGAVVALGSVSGAVNVDLSQGVVFSCTLTGNTTFTFINWPSGSVETEPVIYATQDGTGGRTITLAGVVWEPSGTAPTWDTTALHTNLIVVGSANNGTTIVGPSPPAGGVSVGASLPGSPADGQQFGLIVDDTNGIEWVFQYRTAKGTWRFVGGAPLFASALPTTSVPNFVGSVTNTASYVAMPSGPTLTLPSVGTSLDFTLEYGLGAQPQNSSTTVMAVSPNFGATAAVDGDSIQLYQAQFIIAQYATMIRKTAIAAGTVIGLQTRTRTADAGTVYGIGQVFLRLTPIQVHP